MILRCAKIIVTWLIKHETICSDDRELYEYAVYSLILSFMPLIIIMIMGSFMGKTKESILVILPFMIIRKYSGGYHAKHDWTCFLGSCGLLFFCIYMAAHIPCSTGLCIVTFIAVVSLCICSPIDSENRRLTSVEKKRYKLTACGIAVVFFALFVLLKFLKADIYAVCVAVGLILPSLLQLPYIIAVVWNKFVKLK